MLDLLARHGHLDLGVQAHGDLHTGAHHTVEDVGICLGQALDQALGDRAGIRRYGDVLVPMDEARAACAIDISGRGLLIFDAALPPGAIGNFDHELTEEFLRALALNARMTLHLQVQAGNNAHHMIEATFKALALALRAAVALDPDGARRAQHQGNFDVSPTVGIVDYGMGNRRSVQKALEHVGAQVQMTSQLDVLDSCAGLVIPGVGAFPRAMANLRELGLVDFLRDYADTGRPVIGICLGMQLLFDSSEELEPTPGLGFFPGQVRWLHAAQRLPHIGWNEVHFQRPSALTGGLPAEGCPFYHVHSLAPWPEEAGDVVGTTEYGERFATIVQRDNVAGVQFHPEKSSGDGLRLLANFLGLCAPGGKDVQLAARP